MSLCTLRLRGPAGSSTIQLSPSSALVELRAAIFSVTSIPPERQQLRAGVPPRPLNTSGGDDASLADLGLRSGDVIVVQEGDTSIPTSTQTMYTPATTAQNAASGPNRISHNTVEQATTHQKSSTSSDPIHQPTPLAAKSSKAMPQPANPTNLPEGARPKPNAGNPPVAFGQGADKQQHREGPRATAQPALARNERPQEPATKADRAVTSLSGAKPGLTSLDNAYVKVDAGWLVLRVVPDDNSCMFTALAIALEHDRPGTPRKLRQAVRDAIQSNPSEWSEAVLGMSPSAYARKIVDDKTWGGGVELRIMSELYGIEIDSIDVQTGRVDRFGEEKNYSQNIILIYSGIHYDAVTFTPMEPDGGASYPYDLDFDQTQFSKTSDGFALAAALELRQKLQANHYYTDTAGFALRCEICKKALRGEKEAQAHAKQTGHTSFGEY